MKIFIAGDSTASTHVNPDSPVCGWGHVFGEYFAQEVAIDNRAKNGSSTKSFIEQEHLDGILNDGAEGDYLFIQFGHNDSKPDHRKTEPFITYRKNLNTFVERARAIGLKPVLLTSIHRRRFDINGLIDSTLGDYPAAMREVAKELDVPLIDMTEKSKNLFNKLGVEESKKIFQHFAPGELPEFPDGNTDNTHFCRYGANVMAKLVADHLKHNMPELVAYLKLD